MEPKLNQETLSDEKRAGEIIEKLLAFKSYTNIK